MKKDYVCLQLVLAGSLGGCASATPVVDFYEADSTTLRRFQKITLIDTRTVSAGEFEKLGIVEGIYCRKTYGDVAADNPLAKTQAIDQVKLKAAELGASHIREPECVIQASGDFTNNCRATVICSGEALQISKGSQ